MAYQHLPGTGTAIELCSRTASENKDVATNKTGTWYKPLFLQRLLRGGLVRSLRIGALLSSIVLFINIIWLGHGVARYGISNGYGTILQDSCESVKNLDIWLHLLINVLSTCLQSASNMYVAAYCSPSRKEVDNAHAQRQWLHIGAFGFKNISQIARRKSTIVICLLATSMPFHLLYNSLVFTSLFTNTYVWSVANEDFLRGVSPNITGPMLRSTKADVSSSFSSSSTSLVGDYFLIGGMKYYLGKNDTEIQGWINTFEDIQTSASTWQRLSPHDCVQAYSNIVVSDRRHVILVSNSSVGNNSVLKWGVSEEAGYDMDSNYWICSMEGQLGRGRACNPRKFLNQQPWDVWDYPIEYCLSEVKPAICKLQFSLGIMAVVIVFNTIKLSCMLFALATCKADDLIASPGDATVSFLQTKDSTTTGLSLASHRKIESMWKTPGIAQPYQGAKRWKEAINSERWVVFFIVMFTGIIIVVVLCSWGLVWLKENDFSLDFSSLWSLGFGAVNQYTMVISPNDMRGKDTSDTLPMIFLANLPQVALALIYFTYSSILTTMLLAVDWCRFAFCPQTVMVSTSAHDAHRRTWFLGSPWRYAVLLVITQVLLHWLTSQALFIVQIFRIELDEIPYSKPIILNCGYSPIAIIFSLIVVFLMLFAICALMSRKFPRGAPPVVSTNSAAISAACHPRFVDDDMPFKPLRWGAYNGSPGSPGYCSIMGADMYELGHGKMVVEGEYYI